MFDVFKTVVEQDRMFIQALNFDKFLHVKIKEFFLLQYSLHIFNKSLRSIKFQLIENLFDLKPTNKIFTPLYQKKCKQIIFF